MATAKPASGAMATPAPPRQMSSRLLTMKFMQRAATGVSSPATPTSDSSHKRRKIDHTPESSVPTTPADEIKTFASRSDVKAALQAESRREQLAAEQRTALGYSHNMFETQWVLNHNQTTPDNHDSASEDSDSQPESDDDDWAEQGRQTFGDFSRNKAKSSRSTGRTSILDHDSDDVSSESGSDMSDDDRSMHGRRKRKLNVDDDEAMAALDRVDLTKSSYTKAKGTMSGPPGKSFKFGESRRERRGDNHPKKQKHKGKIKPKKH